MRLNLFDLYGVVLKSYFGHLLLNIQDVCSLVSIEGSPRKYDDKKIQGCIFLYVKKVNSLVRF